MSFSPQKRKDTVSGILFVAIFAAAATYISNFAAVKALGISPLVIGIVIGTYSSIYVAGSLAIALGLTRHNLLPPEKTADDDLP